MKFWFFFQNNVFDVEKEMKSQDTNKASHLSEIPTKILKQNVFFSPLILGYVNKSISSSFFPSILKNYINYINHSRHEKSNYQPISALPILSKIFENILYDQISSFFLLFSLTTKPVSRKASIRKIFW